MVPWLLAFLLLEAACSAESDLPFGVMSYPDQGREHLTTGSPLPVYNSDPPTSGPHAPNTVPCGIHEEPIADVVSVHNLEHGVVMIQYLPTISADELSELKATVADLPDHAVLAPRPGNPAVLALSAWTVLLKLDVVDPEAIRWFWDNYGSQGPEKADCPMEIGMGD